MSTLVRFNYNIIKNIEYFNYIPKFSENSSLIFAQNNNDVFIYSNSNENDNSGELYKLSTDTLKMETLVSSLPNVTDNCLIDINDKIYSFGGKLTYHSGRMQDTISKYYVINYKNGDFLSFDMPSEFKERSNISCAYDSKRNLIFLYGGINIKDNYDESKNEYYNDLWAFNPINNEFKKIIDNKKVGGFLPIDSDGNRIFNGDISYPSFGKNKTVLIYDKLNDRILLAGEIPYNKGIRIYSLKLQR
jgi:hypothetical protein